jgi:hypothetical protein
VLVFAEGPDVEDDESEYQDDTFSVSIDEENDTHGAGADAEPVGMIQNEGNNVNEADVEVANGNNGVMVAANNGVMFAAEHYNNGVIGAGNNGLMFAAEHGINHLMFAEENGNNGEMAAAENGVYRASENGVYAYNYFPGFVGDDIQAGADDGVVRYAAEKEYALVNSVTLWSLCVMVCPPEVCIHPSV